MKTTFARIHKGLALFIALGVFLQMFLAGIWHAEVVSTPEAHIFFGLSLLLASLLALIHLETTASGSGSRKRFYRCSR